MDQEVNSNQYMKSLVPLMNQHPEMTSMYYGRDIRDVILRPLNSMSRLTQQWVSLPMTWLGDSGFAKVTSAQLELTERLTQRYNKPDWEIESITTASGGIYKIMQKTLMRKSFCNLVHFKRQLIVSDEKQKNRVNHLPKVLIVAPYSGHYATLLRDTIRTMLVDHDVFVTDWDNARDVPIYKGKFTLDDYVDYLKDFITYLDTELHIVAVCQPAVPVLALTALLASENSLHQPRSITLMGGPIDARCAETEMTKVAQENPIDWFEKMVVGHVPHYYPGALRRVVPGFAMLAGFMYLNFEKHALAPHDLFSHLIHGDAENAQAHKLFYDEYRSVLDLPADYYLDSVKAVFQEYLLPRGLMRWRGEKIDLKAIRNTALMTVEGEKDDISGVGTTHAAHELCPHIPADKRCHYLQKDVGHYGVFNGRRWRELIQPKIAEFIRIHS